MLNKLRKMAAYLFVLPLVMFRHVRRRASDREFNHSQAEDDLEARRGHRTLLPTCFMLFGLAFDAVMHAHIGVPVALAAEYLRMRHAIVAVGYFGIAVLEALAFV